MAWNIHYRSEFSIKLRDSNAIPVSALIEMIRNWIQHRLKQSKVLNRSYLGEWFSDGGDWKSTNNSYYIRTICHSGDNGSSSKMWALQFFHPCEHKSRKWKVDVALEQTSSEILFAMSVYHAIVKEYIGIIPHPPKATVPKIVKMIIKSNKYIVSSGSEIMRTKPRMLNTGDGLLFSKRVFDENRLCPIVLISCTPDEKFYANPDDVAWNLSGAASVFAYDKYDLHEELYHCIGDTFNCKDGCITTYHPISKEQKFRKIYKYISSRHAESYGSDTIIEILSDGLARRNSSGVTHRIRSYNDIRNYERELNYERIKSKSSEDESFYIQMIEDLESQLRNAVESMQTLQEQISEKDSEYTRLKHRHRAVLQRTRTEYRNNREICSRCDKFKKIQNLPESIIGVVDILKEALKDRIVFIDDAIRSASKSSYPDYVELWSVLFHVYDKLHSYIFKDNDSIGSAAIKFYNETNYRPALTESSATNKDKKLASTREINYNGKLIDASPHITLCHGNDYLRINFGLDNERKVIIIAHCGDHLVTAGTKRRKRN